MPLLRAEAEKLSNNMLQQGIVEEIIDREALFALLPFKPITGKAYVYNRENTLSEGDFLDPNEAVNEEASTFTEVTAKLRILIGDVDVDKFLATTMNDTNDQVATQIQAKAKGLTRKFRRTLAIGDSGVNAKEFDGVKSLVTASQTITAGANGAALSLSMLDELIDAVPNGPDVIMMKPATLRAYKALLRAAGGTEPPHIMLPNFGMPVPAHDGVPIIMNEFLPSNETKGTGADLCSIYAMRLNEVDGLHGIYGGGPVGLQVENLGTVQNKDAWRYRMKWYVGTALKSTQSLARLEAITNS